MAELLIFLGLLTLFAVIARRLPDVVVNHGVVGKAPAIEALPPETLPPAAPKASKKPAVKSYLPEVEALLKEADRLFAQEKFTLAERRYLQAADKDPACVHALNRLGIIYLEQTHELSDAEEAFSLALKLDTDNSYLAHNLGLVYYKQGRFTEAAKLLEGAVEGGSTNPVRYSNLGMCYLALRQYGKAVSALRRALALDKGNLKIKALLDEAKQKDNQHKSLARTVSRH